MLLEITQEEATHKILNLLNEKYSRIVTSDENLTVLRKIGIVTDTDSIETKPVFDCYLTKAEFTILVDSLDKLTKPQLENLLDKLNENAFISFEII